MTSYVPCYPVPVPEPGPKVPKPAIGIKPGTIGGTEEWKMI